MASKTLILLLSVSCLHAEKHSKGPHYKVHCTKDHLRVDIVKQEDVSDIYLQHLKEYPDPSCKPEIVDRRVTFSLDLEQFYRCMVTKVVSATTGRTVYYHHVVVEHKDRAKEAIMVKCDMGLQGSNNASSYDAEVEAVSLVKRQADFGDNFREAIIDNIEEIEEVKGYGPTPILGVGVRQAGTLIDDELRVKPGTPLNMEVYLDSVSADVYGLAVTGMDVTDTGNQVEPILVNGCSVDPYLFENFATSDGDYLRAKFRAFKFPESPFVLFRGTVNVCLSTCSPVRCSNGQLGYGRRRRDISEEAKENKVYTISMSTIIKMECDDCTKAEHVEKGSLREKFEYSHSDEKALSALFEEFGSSKFAYFEGRSNSQARISGSLAALLAGLLLCWVR